MNDFWSNILRYPRFFISSVAGLLIVIDIQFIYLSELFGASISMYSTTQFK